MATREDLLKLLTELGVPEAERVGDEHELTSRISRELFGLGGQVVPLSELAERIGMDEALAERLVRAAGLNDFFVTEDLPVFETFKLMADLVGEDQALHLARVAGASIRRIADAGAAAMRVNWEAPLIAESSYSDYLRGSFDVMGDLFPRLGTLFERLFRHFVVLTSEQGYDLTPGRAATTMPLVVGFADVVGFTQRAATVSTEDLASVIDRFEDRVSDAVAAHGGRVVKYIGDEVMFVFEDARPACTCALDLIALSANADIPEVRAGLASGSVLLRFGDFYGPVVNLAARLVGVAPPNSVLVNRSVVDDVEGFTFEEREARELKGIADPVVPFELTGGSTGDLPGNR